MRRSLIGVLGLVVLLLGGCFGPPDASSTAESVVKGKVLADLHAHHPDEAGGYHDIQVLCGNAQQSDKTVYDCDVTFTSAIGTTNNQEKWVAKSDSSGNIVSADLKMSDLGQ